MTLDACLDGAIAGHRLWQASMDMTVGEAVVGVLGLGLFVAAAAAPLGQAIYSRRMRGFMAMRELADAPEAWWQRRARRFRSPAVASPDDAAATSDAVCAREQRLRRATWIAYAVFVVCGVPALWTQADRGLGNAATVLAYVVLMPLGPALVNMRAHRPGWLLWLVPFGLVVVALTADSPMLADEVVGTAALLLCLQLVSVHRTLRATVGPLMVVFAALFCAVLASTWLQASIQHCMTGGFAEGPALALGVLLTLTHLAVLVAGFLAAVALLRVTVRVIDAGWLSDLSLVAVSGLVVIAGLLLMAADADGATPSLLTLYFLLWVGATVVAYALALSARPCPPQARSLLVLRVFSRDAKAERMLDALQTRWRLVGPVLEIGGPDLAKLNLDLHEFVKLLTGRLYELLYPRGVPAAAFAASLDLAMDREGRFRINEVYCFDSSWQTMVERLMGMSDVILLDLRGFDAQRGGTTHEVLRLAATGALARVVAVSDAKTDWAHFDATVALAGGGAGPACKIDATAADAQERGFAALLAAAAAPARVP